MNPEAPLPIHDMLLRPLPAQAGPPGTHWPLPSWDEPWLRRYGEAEVIRLGPDEPAFERMRRVADEVWALLEGEIDVMAEDRRPDSPTHHVQARFHFTEPTLVLIPFGVRLQLKATGPSTWLVRMATHSEAEDPVTAG